MYGAQDYGRTGEDGRLNTCNNEEDNEIVTENNYQQPLVTHFEGAKALDTVLNYFTQRQLLSNEHIALIRKWRDNVKLALSESFN